MPTPEVFIKHAEILHSKTHKIARTLKHLSSLMEAFVILGFQATPDQESIKIDCGTSNLFLSEFHDIIIKYQTSYGVKLPYRIIFSKSFFIEGKKQGTLGELLIKGKKS